MHIEKRGYSSRPWRLVDRDGNELMTPATFNHPDLGSTNVMEPVCGTTRKECEAGALALLEKLIDERRCWRSQIDEAGAMVYGR